MEKVTFSIVTTKSGSFGALRSDRTRPSRFFAKKADCEAYIAVKEIELNTPKEEEVPANAVEEPEA